MNYRPIALHSTLRKVFVEVLHDICSEIVQLDPSQFGFQKNKRCSDLAAINQTKIRQHLKNKNLGELYIATFDFSKAYDSCDHRILFQTLNNHGISGKLLNIIQSMYDRPQAQIFLNGKYSEPFTIERGVAQGCKLSTLLFNIYINPLLKKLTQHNKSAELLPTFPLCYADDLVILSKNRDGLIQSIKIIETWCKANYISINTKKSGILTVNVPPDRQNIKIDNILIPVKNTIKYLGFTLSNTGTWGDHVQQKINIAYGIFNQHRKILTSDNLSYKIRIRIAESKIFSHLRYGEEIFILDTNLSQKLQACENNILKSIIGLPRSTSSTGLMFMMGRITSENRQKEQRLNNYCRIQKQKYSHLWKLFNDPDLNKPYLLPGKTRKDVDSLLYRQKTRSKTSFIDPTIFSDKNISKTTYKNIIKRYHRRENHTSLYRSLISNNKIEIINNNSRLIDVNLINTCGKKYNSLIHWKLGGTYQNVISYQNKEEFELVCPLCTNIYNDTSQVHLTSSCIKTYINRERYKKEINRISNTLYKEYRNLNNDSKLIWSMTSGRKSRQRIENQQFKITEGKSIQDGVDKNDPQDVAYAFDQFDAILGEIQNNVVIYTDGSKTNDQVGAGSIIYHNSKTLTKLSRRLKNCGNNAAELYAILQALYWTEHNIPLGERKTIHIFSDSRYSIDCLSEQSQITSHQTLVEEIQDKANHMQSEVILHWIPSHIELMTDSGKRTIIGNFKADILAYNAAVSNEIPLDYNKIYVTNTEALQDATAKFVYGIDKQLRRKWESWNSQNASPSQDDFSLSDAQQIPAGDR